MLLASMLWMQPVRSQKDYSSEIGLQGGASLLVGDANVRDDMGPIYGLLYRYRFNQRLALKVEGAAGEVRGLYDVAGSEASFRNNVSLLDACGEFNFLNYAQRQPDRTAMKFSSYIFLGAGAMAYNYNAALDVQPCVSFGLGFKVKLGKRWNANLQYTNRLLLADNMEGLPPLNNTGNLNGSNFLNNDLLTSLTLGLTFNFWHKDCKCMGF